MHNSSVWQEYFYIFKVLWRSVHAAFDVLTKDKPALAIRVNEAHTND
jgi:hypothetical protein